MHGLGAQNGAGWETSGAPEMPLKERIESLMPRFMDVHTDLLLPPEAIEQLRSDAQAQRHDEFGVRQVELYYNHDGHVYCLLEAPDAEAVHRHHAALGVPCGEVQQVESLL
jgi:hypothetical protein